MHGLVMHIGIFRPYWSTMFSAIHFDSVYVFGQVPRHLLEKSKFIFVDIGEQVLLDIIIITGTVIYNTI